MSTRHTFCTRFCENETNVKVIQSIMGHASIETTIDIYASFLQVQQKSGSTAKVQQIPFFAYCMALNNTLREITGILDNTGFYCIVP